MSYAGTMKTSARDEFEAWAGTYDRSLLNRFMFQPSYRMFLEELYAWRKDIDEPFDLLDIGCGYGYFLAACREKGYEVQGLDISDWAVRYATEKLRLPVAVGDLGNHALFQKEFDVITMWHFLEHTPDPHGALRSAKAWLKKDGLLVVEVPNYQGTDAQKRWQDWEG